MPQLPITLIKGDDHGDEVDYRDNLLVNMYAVPKKIHGTQGYLTNYPGLSSFGIGYGKDRGGVYNERQSNHYRVSEKNFISVDEYGVVTNIGSVTGNEQVALPYSFNTQAIIAGQKMWLYSPSSGFNEITDSDLGNPIDGIWIDGYYFLTDGEYIYHTDIDDETSIDPLKFATAEFSPDPTLGLLKTQDNKIAVFGRYSLEYFVNAATDNFAFQRVETRAQKIGIVATHAKCESEGVFYIVGGRKEEAVFVYQVGIGNSQKISTREIDKIIAQYSENDLIDIRMESRTQDNITFVIIHLPNETLCYNSTIANIFGAEAAWTILKTDTLGNSIYRGINNIFDPRLGKWIIGDKFDETIGYLDELVPTHYDAEVEWILYSPFIALEIASINEIEIETIPGFNNINDATVALSLTYNGVTFSKEYWMQYSQSKNYDQRFIARRLGYVNDWIGFKFRGISTSKMAFSLMTLNYG